LLKNGLCFGILDKIVKYKNLPSPLMGEGVPCGVGFNTPQGKGEDEAANGGEVLLFTRSSYSRKNLRKEVG